MTIDVVKRSLLDHLRLVVSNGVEMPSKRSPAAASQPATTPAPTKPKKDTFHVLLPTKTRDRIAAALSQIEKNIGFPPNTTECVLHLLDDALKRLEKERADAPPPSPPRDRLL